MMSVGLGACGTSSETSDASQDASVDGAIVDGASPDGGADATSAPSVDARADGASLACAEAGAGASGGDGGQPCQSSAECPSGQGCGFLLTDACCAKGTCQPLVGGGCAAVPICACDGTLTRSCSFAGGYAEAPAFFPIRVAPCGGADASP